MSNYRLTRYVLTSCFLATLLEIFDFVIFAFLTPMFYANYLNFLDPSTALIVSYALFGVGFFFRPLGALIFGYIGDTFGRKQALVLSVSMMGTASLTMFALPTYELIGVWACYIIVLVRIIQGISVGGEYSGSLLFAMEHSKVNKVGRVGAIIQLGSTTGVLLAMFCSNWLQNPALPSYSWRFVFLVGFGLSLVGYFIRKKLGETPIFQNRQQSADRIPLIEGLRNHKIKCLVALLLAGANTANFYFYLVYVPNYVKDIPSLELGFAGVVITALTIFTAPVVGRYADKYGRLTIIFIATTTAIIYGFGFLWCLMNISNLYIISILLLLASTVVSLMMVSINIFVLEIFPANCRFSCGGVSYSLGAALFGGTTPMVCSMLVERFDGNVLYIGSYISLISLLGLVAGFLYYRVESDVNKKQLHPLYNKGYRASEEIINVV